MILKGERVFKTYLYLIRYADSTFYCVAEDGKLAACANNCLGVNPNAIVVGGMALAATATTGIAWLNVLGGLGAVVSDPGSS